MPVGILILKEKYTECAKLLLNSIILTKLIFKKSTTITALEQFTHTSTTKHF